jgi:hypothetical protein
MKLHASVRHACFNPMTVEASPAEAAGMSSIDASGRGNYDAPAQHEGLTTWCRGR